MSAGEILQNVRKAEALFLPLFPAAWRKRPPSYRLILPVLVWLAKRKRRNRWAEPALAEFEHAYLATYHKKSFQSAELDAKEIGWLRGIMGVALIVTLLGALPFAAHFSFAAKVGLLLGGAALLVRGAMEFGPGPFWIAWTLAFHCAVMLGPASSYAAPRILTLFGLLWTVAVVEPRVRWRLIDVVGTVPILFIWYRAIENTYLPQHPLWHSGLLALILWAIVWGLLSVRSLPMRLNMALQFVWTASLFIFGVTMPLRAFLHLPPLAVSLGAMAVVCGTMSFLAPPLRGFRELYRARTVAGVFALMGVLVFFSAKGADKAGWSDTAIDYASGWLWPVWWIAGATLTVSAYKLSHRILKWLIVVLPAWILPCAVWLLVIIAWKLGKFSSFEKVAGNHAVLFCVGAFALGATLLALTHRTWALTQWLFWGLFSFFILSAYWKASSDLVSYQEGSAAGDQGALPFLFMAVWLIGLALVAAQSWRGWLKTARFAHGPVILAAGSLLWFLLAQLWSTHVDHFTGLGGRVSLKQRINLELLNGATFLGFVMLVGEMIRKREKVWSLQVLPWGLILVCGIFVPQVLQGVEHWNYAHTHGYSFNALQTALHQMASQTLNQSVSGLIVSPWWRVVRWVAATGILTVILLRCKSANYGFRELLLTLVFSSLAVATAEVIWIDWPGMSNDWSPLLRPWNVSVVAWNPTFLAQCVIYAALGIVVAAMIWILRDARAAGREAIGAKL